MNLSEMIHSEEFQAWHDSLTSNYGFSNPELYGRILNAAENGLEGRTHGEIIDEWHDYLRSLSSEISDEEYATIEQEINACEQWHLENGSLGRSA